MIDDRWIRTPNVSDGRVTLKTGENNSAQPDFNPEADTNDTPAATNEARPSHAGDNPHLEYQGLKKELDDEKQRLEEERRMLAAEREAIEEEKASYRQIIEEKLTSEMEARYEAEYRNQSTELLRIIESLSHVGSDSLRGLDDEIVDIVFESVCKIVGRHSIDPHIVRSITGEVIAHAEGRMHMLVRVAPGDLKIITDALDSLGNGLIEKLDIVADERVAYGGCILETDAGEIDGRLDQQLNSLKDLLLGERARRMDGHGDG